MIDEPTQFKIGELSVEVNWNESVKPCKKFKLKLGDKETIINYNDLYGMLFMFGNEESKSDLIPVKHSKIIMAKREVRMRAKKDIKRGDIIQTTYEYPIAEDVFYKLKQQDKHISLSNKSIESHFVGK